MRIDFDLQEMISTLDYITGVVEESGVEESLRNVIFRPIGEEKTSLEVIGYSRVVNTRIRLIEAQVSDFSTTEDKEFTQIKAKPFLSFLKALNSATRTKIGYTYLETDREYLNLYLEEDAADEEDELAEFLNNQLSVKRFMTIPMKEADRKALKNDVFKEETEGIVSKDIRFYLDSLLPLMDGKTDIGSKIYFTEDLVYVQNSFTFLGLENILREDLRGFSLTLPVVRFLSKVLVGNDVVSLGKNDSFLCIATDNMRVLVQYSPKILDISRVFAAIADKDSNGNPKVYRKSLIPDEKMDFINRDTGIIIDKLRMRDILKRFKVEDDVVSLKLDTTNSRVKIESPTFSTTIPMLGMKNEEKLNGVVLSLAIDALSNMLFGDSEMFTSDVFMYLTLLGQGCVITTVDDTGTWLSMVKVRYSVNK